MKNIFLIICLFVSLSSFAQPIRSMRIHETESVKLIESITNLEVFNGRQLRIAVFQTANAIGSANLPGSDEVSGNLLICVAHYDEHPDSRVFSVGPFLNPKILKKVDSGQSVALLIEDGLAAHRKTSKVLITETDVRIQ